MNKELNLCAVIMHSKPGYKTGKKHKIFDNLLNQNFTVDCKNKVWCTDFTYMRQTNGKFRYNCSIIDLFDRLAVASIYRTKCYKKAWPVQFDIKGKSYIGTPFYNDDGILLMSVFDFLLNQESLEFWFLKDIYGYYTWNIF